MDKSIKINRVKRKRVPLEKIEKGTKLPVVAGAITDICHYFKSSIFLVDLKLSDLKV